MQDSVKNGNGTPFLVPIAEREFWDKVRSIIRDELGRLQEQRGPTDNTFKVDGLVEKPLYTMEEVCELFHVTRPTIYDWIKHGALRPVKIRSRVYFLWQEIQGIIVKGRK